MEWLWLVVLGFALVGAGLALRERRTGRGKIIDERSPAGPQTEADRDAIRAQDMAQHHSTTPDDHQ